MSNGLGMKLFKSANDCMCKILAKPLTLPSLFLQVVFQIPFATILKDNVPFLFVFLMDAFYELNNIPMLDLLQQLNLALHLWILNDK